jgi:hypothetical protein
MQAPSASSRHQYQWPSFVSYNEGPHVFVLSLSALRKREPRLPPRPSH